MYKDSVTGGADGIISICFICDEGYVMPTVVAISSILVNRNREDIYDIFIVANNLSNATLEMLYDLEDMCFWIHIIQIDVSEKYAKFEMKNCTFNTTALLKFELPNLLPANLGKVLYLDGDVVAQKDLAPVFRESVDDVYAGVIKDFPIATNKNNVDFRLRLNIQHKAYFNSGVLLLNLKKMREDCIPELLMEYRMNHTDKFMDQDTFNVILRENVKYMPLYYNLQYGCWIQDQKELTDYYNLKEGETKYEWKQKAIIIHFTKYKLWKYFDYFAADVWLHYYLLSPFKDVPLVRVSLNEELNVAKYAKLSTLRIDIKNRGIERNNIIEKSVIPKPTFLRRPGWLPNGMTIESAAGRMTVILQCQGDGNLEVALMGRDERNAEGNRYPVWIDCTYFAVNGKTIFSDTKTVCHDKRYVYKKAVKDGEEVKLEVKWTECQTSNVLDEYRQLQTDLKKANSNVITTEAALRNAKDEIVKSDQEKQKIAKTLEKAKQKNAKLERELKNVKNGWSFKVGRIITWLPRKIKSFFKLDFFRISQ